MASIFKDWFVISEYVASGLIRTIIYFRHSNKLKGNGLKMTADFNFS